MALPAPTFDGVSLGPACSMRTYANPVARQVNEYPGINGLEVLNMGSRGATTECDGVLVADTLANLASYQSIFMNYQLDGGAYTLFDTKGTTWPLVILVDFRPEGMVKVGLDGYLQAYRAAFLHII